VPFVVLVLFCALAARAEGATYCVGVRADGCVDKATAADAFTAARADTDRDTILLGRISETGAFADATDRPVRVVGLGADATRLRAGTTAPALRLLDPGSSARELRADSLQLDDGAQVSSAVVGGAVRARGGDPQLSSVVASSVAATCDASELDLELDHVTVSGTGDAGVTIGCDTPGRTAAVTVANSIVWGFTRAFATGNASSVSTTYSDYPGATGDTNMAFDPRFQAPGDVRLRPDSPLVDRGRPGPLSDAEPHEDALGYVRVVDGNADGTPRRDIGALELQPPAPFPLPGNVLTNPGAEGGTAATDDMSSPAPPGWTRTGAFTSVRYGTVAGVVPFPSRRVSEVLAAGDAFFAAGPGKGGSATQVVDLRDAAPEIDMGRGTIALSAALGGYRASGDGAIVEATFRAPGGASLGSVRIGPVTAADRANATTLLPRRADAPIPPLTRTVAVTLRSTPASGSYDDAYFDSVSLVPRTGGLVPHADPSGPKLRSFLGATVVSRRLPVDSRRRVWVRLACSSRTVKRCRGSLALTARLAKKGPVRRIARRTFSLRHGHAKRLPIRLNAPARRAISRSRKLRDGRAYPSARDGQGLTRAGVAIVRIVRGSGFGR
jgi:hypothetical protein